MNPRPIPRRPIPTQLFRPIPEFIEEEPHRKSVRVIEPPKLRRKKIRPSDSRYKQDTIIQRTLGVILRAFGSSVTEFENKTQLPFSRLVTALNETGKLPFPSKIGERIEKEFYVNNNLLFVVRYRTSFGVYWINMANPVYNGPMSSIYRIIDLREGIMEMLKIQTEESATRESEILDTLKTRGKRDGFVHNPQIIRVVEKNGTSFSWTIGEKYKCDLLGAKVDFSNVEGFDPEKVIVVTQLLFMLKILLDQGVMAGDIKLQNYLFDGTKVYMNDFGGSCLFNRVGEKPDFLHAFTYISEFDQNLLFQCNTLTQFHYDFYEANPDASFTQFKTELEKFQKNNLTKLSQRLDAEALKKYKKIMLRMNNFWAFSKDTTEEFIASFVNQTNMLKHKIDVFLTGIAIFDFYTGLKPYDRDNKKRLNVPGGINFAVLRKFNQTVRIPQLVQLVLQMISEDWEDRPNINEILPKFNSILVEFYKKQIDMFEKIYELGPQYREFFHCNSDLELDSE